MNEINHGDDETADECSRRAALKTLGVAGAGIAGSVVATGDVSASGPTAVIEAPSLPPESGESITFDGSGSSGNIQKYEWELRNNTANSSFGSWANGSSFTESFTDGAYSVKLIVTDDSGNTDSAVVDFIIRDKVSPEAHITAEPLDASSDRKTFVGRSSYSPRGSIEQYKWELRNDSVGGEFGKYAEGPSFSESLTNYEYTIRLTVTDSRGRTASDTVTFQA